MAVARVQAPTIGGHIGYHAKLGQVKGGHGAHPNEQHEGRVEDERHDEDERGDEYDKVED